MGSVIDIQNVKSRHLSLLTGSGGLKQQRGTDHLEIDVLMFRCPTTQRDTESGIEMDRCTFLRLGQFSVRVHCRACGHRHEFKVANGSLAPFTVSVARFASNSPSPTVAPDQKMPIKRLSLEISPGMQERPDVSAEERASSKLVKRIRKLRWIGKVEEAERMAAIVAEYREANLYR